MKSILSLALLIVLVSLGATTAQEKKKAEKVSGDVGLLDLEKNYLILVTKEGKLITLDFDKKTKAILLKSEKANMGDVGLGSSASVEYTEKGDKKILSGMEFLSPKGGE